jgi:hypothetical protein
LGVAAAGRLIAYAAEPTAEVVYPLAVAMAWMVSLELTAIALEYTLEEVVGVVPLVV